MRVSRRRRHARLRRRAGVGGDRASRAAGVGPVRQPVRDLLTTGQHRVHVAGVDRGALVRHHGLRDRDEAVRPCDALRDAGSCVPHVDVGADVELVKRLRHHSLDALEELCACGDARRSAVRTWTLRSPRRPRHHDSRRRAGRAQRATPASVVVLSLAPRARAARLVAIHLRGRARERGGLRRRGGLCVSLPRGEGAASLVALSLGGA